jgi:hypothetical protein
MAVTMKNSVFRDVTQILVTLIKWAPSFSETSVLTRATRRNIPEDAILHETLVVQDAYIKTISVAFSPQVKHTD